MTIYTLNITSYEHILHNFPLNSQVEQKFVSKETHLIIQKYNLQTTGRTCVCASSDTHTFTSTVLNFKNFKFFQGQSRVLRNLSEDK